MTINANDIAPYTRGKGYCCPKCRGYIRLADDLQRHLINYCNTDRKTAYEIAIASKQLREYNGIRM